jgi:exosortase family protein XrtF
MSRLFQENKTAFFFIVKFVGLYLVLNTLYGFYIEFFNPLSDPVTITITTQVASVLSLFHSSIQVIPDPLSPYVILQKDFQPVVNVFEGCNGLNVMIVYISFLFAFKGPFKSGVIFLLLGLVSIYLMNLIRVTLLFEIAYFYPDRLYFFHKYLFTGIIYLVVFVIWFFWIKHVREGEKRVA